MTNPLIQGKSINELLPYWPKLVWVCSYSGTDQLTPNPKTAVLKKIESSQGYLQISAEDQGREFLSQVLLTDQNVRNMVFSALSKARGKTIEVAGGEKV